jgi:glutamate N-acetyltransferase/amino-acid N-acetyltransferase
MAGKSFEVVEGGILAAEGFVAATIAAGIKPEGLDMLLLHSEAPAAAAATLTTNQMRAAPTYVTEQHVADGSARTVIVSSGNANAATGEQGMAAAVRMAELAAQATGVEVTEALVCSTGRIGVQLPMDEIEAAVPKLAQKLSRESADEAARAIMTTDTVPKQVAVRFRVGETPVSIGAICKGAGMICPNMATMLCFIATDLAIEPALLRSTLQSAVARSFNCISVDGDMSTNDTVIVLANGAAGNNAISAETDAGYEAFSEALGFVTVDLAKRIAADGEGASKFVEVRVTGAASYEDAHRVARSITNYNLVKTWIYGGEFNWGRAAAAVGAAGVPLEPSSVEIRVGGIAAFVRGEPAEYDEEAAAAAMSADEIVIEVDLGAGDERATAWTCDLTPEYVHLNAT